MKFWNYEKNNPNLISSWFYRYLYFEERKDIPLQPLEEPTTKENKEIENYVPSPVEQSSKDSSTPVYTRFKDEKEDHKNLQPVVWPTATHINRRKVLFSSYNCPSWFGCNF